MDAFQNRVIAMKVRDSKATHPSAVILNTLYDKIMLTSAFPFNPTPGHVMESMANLRDEIQATEKRAASVVQGR